MKHIFLLFSLLFFCFHSYANKQLKEKTIYLFGISNDINDSIYYFTPIQKIEQAIFNQKTGFLTKREIYSQQVEQYIQKTFKSGHQTCAIFYLLDFSQTEKKYKHLYYKYTKKQKKDIKTLKEFQFMP